MFLDHPSQAHELYRVKTATQTECLILPLNNGQVEDIIAVLPENIANQIAAGEVIQRPASAVKELLENAVDAGASEIRLHVNDAGKSLVQVIDNGNGMSETDARRCFERHATSKIHSIEDLFHIRTMGFRGEALASIAGVSQVELRTRKRGEATGTYLEVENSAITLQEPVATAEGTNIMMKNLFFNVPARRNFLKSNTSELRHIVEEFIRVAMAFPGIFFSFTSNGQEVFHLEKGSLKQRIIQILGNAYQSRLVSVREETSFLNISGFVGKPDTARKTRGEQYLFVNNRFIKSAYLHHAVMNAFSDMIPRESFPMYALFIELDPSRVDINVHPTKQEIKFEDEKTAYAFVQSAVKHALAQFSVTPALDFELDGAIQQSRAVSQPFTPDKQEAATGTSLYKTFTQKNQAHFIESKSNLEDWKVLYPSVQEAIRQKAGENPDLLHEPSIPGNGATDIPQKFQAEAQFQALAAYIIAKHAGGYLVVDQQRAHERVLYERFLMALRGKPIATQKTLFPVTLELPPADAVLAEALLPDLRLLGYDIEPFGKNTLVVHGSPADVTEGNEKASLENMLEQFKHFQGEPGFDKREKLLRSLAWQQSVKPGRILSAREMQGLLDDLLECANPLASPSGKPVLQEFRREELEKMFGR